MTQTVLDGHVSRGKNLTCNEPTYPALMALDTRIAVLMLVVCTAAARPVVCQKRIKEGNKGGLLTVVGGVGNANRILLILELLDRADRSEDLLLDDLHVLIDVGEDSRLDVVALVAETLATGDHLGTVLLAGLDVAHDAVKLELGDLRSLEGVLGEGVANLVLQRALLEALQELVVDGLVDQDPRAGAAALPVVEVDAKVDPRDGVVDVGVREDDVGRLTTQLQRDLLEVALGRRLQDLTADQGRAREGDLVDIHVVRDGRTCDAAKAREDVDDARREASLLDQLGGIQTRQRGLLSRLQHDGVARRDGGADLPGPHEQGEVPRDDLAADTNGLVAGVVEAAGVGVDGLAVDLVGPAAVVTDAASRVGHVQPGHAHSLAIVKGFDVGEDLGITLEEVSQLGQQATPL